MSGIISQKQALVLSLLVARGEAYGLELVEHSNGGLGRGTIYVTLGRMEEAGLVESWQEEAPPGHRGPARRKYRATGEGSRALDVWQNRMTGMFSGLKLALGMLSPGRPGVPAMAVLAFSPVSFIEAVNRVLDFLPEAVRLFPYFLVGFVFQIYFWRAVRRFVESRSEKPSEQMYEVGTNAEGNYFLKSGNFEIVVGEDSKLYQIPLQEIVASTPPGSKAWVSAGLVAQLLMEPVERASTPKLVSIPNAGLVDALAFIMTRKAFKLYVEPTYADFCDEYPKSLAAGRYWHCRWISVRVVVILLFTALTSGVLSKIMALFPKRG